MKALILQTAAAAALAAVIAAQQPPAPRFEVASIKPNTSGAANGSMRGQPGGMTGVNMPIRTVIAFAHQVPGTRLVGGPDWLATDRYDITARFPEGTPTLTPADGADRLASATQAMLAERFRLVVHREAREMDVYALVVARPGTLGPAIKPSAPDACTKPDQPVGLCGMQGTPGRIRFGAQPLSVFATNLGGAAGRVVVDRTGLSGNYDFELTFAADASRRPPAPGDEPPSVDPNAPSIFVALREQLGLKLEPARAPVEVVVIDSIERPAAD